MEGRIQALNDAQVKQLLGRLMLDLDQENGPILDEADLRERSVQDRELVQAVARQLELAVPADAAAVGIEGAKLFLAAVASLSPQHAELVESGLSEVESSAPRLDFGASAFAINLLLLAISGAVLRPSLEWSSEAGPGGVSKKRFSFKVQGVKDIEKLIKTLLPFLR